MPDNTTYSLSVGLNTTQAERDAAELGRKAQRVFQNSFNTSSLTRPLGAITASTDEFSKSMAAANARVIAFGASAGIIFQVAQGLKGLVSSTVEVNKALTELNVLFNKNKEDLASFGSEIFRIAKETGQSFKEIASGATELARQGLGAEETLTRLKDAAILSRQAGFDLQESVDTLTASINSFSKSALTSTEIVNKFANVDAAFAVSSKDLAEALKRVGSTAQDAGVDINELIGLVTSAQQTTARGGAVIGNALKTIFTRIERPQVIQQLEEVGVAVKNLDGTLKPTTEILTGFAKVFDTASESQQSYLAELVGSVYQINILKALLGDLSKEYSVAGEATLKASSAQNEAIKRNEEYNKSLSAVLNRSKETFREIAASVGDLTVAPVISNATSILDSLFGKSGEEAEGFGEQIAEGALKGFGNFLSGPGLALISGVIGKLLLDFTKFAGQAGQDFLGLNKLTKEQSTLTAQLNQVLASQPALRDAILSKSLSQVEVEKLLLTITKQRIAEEEKLAQVINTSSASLLKSGNLGFNKAGLLYSPQGAKPKDVSRSIPNYSMGGVPNFNSQFGYGALYKAIQREKASGVPESLIRVGQDDSLKGPKNPIGLGIFNLRDEPKGLKQGIQRALEMGVDPKSHGIKGSVPNYADRPIYQREESLGPTRTRSGLSKAFNSPESFEAEIQKEIFDRLQSLKRAVSLGALQQESVNNIVDQIKKEYALLPQAISSINRSLKSTASYQQQQEKAAEEAANEARKSASFFAPKGKIGEILNPNIPFNPSFLPERFRPKQGPFFNPESLAPQRLLEKVTPNLLQEENDSESRRLRASLARPLLDEKLRARQEKIAQETARLEERLRSGIESAGKLSSLVPFTQSFRDAQLLRQENRTAFDASRATLNQKIAGASLGVSIGSPIVAGAASQVFNNNSTTQRGLGAATQSLGNIASYAALGATVGGGVPGLIVGAGAGSALELPSVIKAFTDNLPDLTRNLETANKTFASSSENLRKYITLEDKLKDSRFITLEKRQSLESEKTEAFANLSPSSQQKLISTVGSKGIGGLVDLQRTLEREAALTTQALEFETVFGRTQRRSRRDLSILPEDLKNNTRKEEFFIPESKDLISTRKNLEKALQQGNAAEIARLRSTEKLLTQQRVFTPQGISESDAFNRQLNTTLSNNNQPIVKQTSEFLKSLRESINIDLNQNNSASALQKVLNLIPEDNEAQLATRRALTTNQQENPEQFVAFLKRYLERNLSEDFIKRREELEGKTRSSTISSIKEVDNFTSILFKTNEAMRNFSLTLDNANKSVLQNLEFQQRRNSVLSEGLQSRQENFRGPVSLLELKTQTELQNLQSQTKIDRTSITQNLSQNIDKVLSQSVISNIGEKIQKILSDSSRDSSGNPSALANSGFNFVAPIEKLNREIQSALSESNNAGADRKINELLTYLDKKDSLILPDIGEVGIAQEESDAKKLIEEIRAGVSAAQLQASQSNTILNQRETQQKELIELQKRELLRNIDIQKQVSFGGGLQNLLNNSTSFSSNIQGGLNTARIGDKLGSSGVAGSGRLQIAETLQSLGVDIQQSNGALFEDLVRDTTRTIEQIAAQSNITLNKPASEIARTQVSERFKTESNLDELLRESKSLYTSLTASNDTLSQFIKKATSDGFNVSVINPEAIAKALKAEPKNEASAKTSSFEEVLTNLQKAKTPQSSRVLSPFISREGPAFQFKDVGDLSNLNTPSGFNRPRQENTVLQTSGPSEVKAITLFEQINEAVKAGASRNNFNNVATNFAGNVAGDRSQTDARLVSILKNVNDARKFSISLEKTELDLAEQLASNQLTLLDYVKKVNIEREKTLSLAAKQAFNEGSISGEELNQQLRSESSAKIAGNDFSIKDSIKLFGSELTAYNEQDFFGDIRDGAVDTARTIKSEFSNAFKDFATGVSDADDAFRNFGLSILSKITDITSNISTNLLFSAIGSGVGALTGNSNSGLSSILSGLTKKKGGIIGYSKGGKVKGGSGVTDDVPALLTKGEYVIKKSAVQKIGERTLDVLNEGSYGKGDSPAKKGGSNFDVGALTRSTESSGENSFSTIIANAFAFNDESRPTGGYFNVGSQLSSLGQTDEDNPANRLKFQREGELLDYLRAKRGYDVNKRNVTKAFNRSQSQGLTAAYIQAGITVAGGAFKSYQGSSSYQGPKGTQTGNSSFDFNQDYNKNFANYVNKGGMATYSGFKRYNRGGAVFGGDSPTDNIPALLTGGEYVIKKNAVDKYGPGFFDRLNRGEVFRGKMHKFADGGLVGSYESNPSRQSDNSMARVVEAINRLTETTTNFNNSLSSRSPSQPNQPVKESSSNINITVNVSKDGSTNTNQNSSNSGESSDIEKSKKLAELIKNQTIKVIQEQQRNGGLLASSK